MRALRFGTLVLVGVVAVMFWLHRSGTLQFNRPSPERYTITGIDVSHHQGEIDWKQVASSGAGFAFIKASEGGDWVDDRFDYNWREANAAGLAVGPYHFFTFCSPGTDQARHFLRTAPPSPGSLPPVVDVEFAGNCRAWSDALSVRADLGAFLVEVEKAWGIRPILYTTRAALEQIVGDDLQGYPIWIRSVFFEPPMDAFRGWALWQFSDNSRVPGITGPVDRNALRPGTSLQMLRVASAQ